MALNMRSLRASQKAPVAGRVGRKAMVCSAAAAPVGVCVCEVFPDATESLASCLAALPSAVLGYDAFLTSLLVIE